MQEKAFTKFGGLIEKYSAFLFDCDGVIVSLVAMRHR